MDDNRDRMTDRLDVQVRRSPRYSVFIALGVFLGFVVAGVLSMLPVDTSVLTTEYSSGAVLGILMMVLGILGAAVGGAAALVLDRMNAKRARTYTVQAEYVASRRKTQPAETAQQVPAEDEASQDTSAEARATDSPSPEAASPEAASPEARAPEGGAAGGGVPEGATPEGRTPDSGTPDPGTPGGERPDAGGTARGDVGQ